MDEKGKVAPQGVGFRVDVVQTNFPVTRCKSCQDDRDNVGEFVNLERSWERESGRSNQPITNLSKQARIPFLNKVRDSAGQTLRHAKVLVGH